MSLDRSPSFQYYPRDWITDYKVARLSLEEEGAYHRVLSHMWDGSEDYCSLPKDVDLLASLWRVGTKRAQRILNVLQAPVGRLFIEEERDGVVFLVSKRLREERNAQVEHRTRQSENGKRGAQARWGSHSDPNSTATDSPMAKDSSSSAPSSSTAVPDEPVSKAGAATTQGAPALTAAAGIYERALGRTLGPEEIGAVATWCRSHPLSLVEHAIRLASARGNLKAQYVGGVMASLIQEGWKPPTRSQKAKPPCPECEGMRLVPEDRSDLDSPFVKCPKCGGTGVAS